MPVVTVLAPIHPDIGALLAGIADGVAAALGLGAGDVIAVHAPAGATAVSGAGAVGGAGWGPSTWVVVTVQGSSRGDAKMEAARDAAASATTGWIALQGLEHGGVWMQWLTPMP